MPDLGGSFGRPFDAQLAAFRLRLGNLVPTSRWDDLRGYQHDRAFMVAGAAKADLLADLARAVDKAISEGTGYDAFRQNFRRIVKQHGWHGWTGEGSRAGEEWRMRTIYRTNMRTTYMAGRYAQLRDGNYPYWVYRHSGAAHPRLDHMSWDGLALPPGHAFWATHYPPNGWGCGCLVEGARGPRRLKRLGADPKRQPPAGWDQIDPKTGTLPGIGRNWDHAPGATTAAEIKPLAEKLKNYPAMIAADFFERVTQKQLSPLSDAFGAFVDAALTSQPQGRHMTVGALRPSWIKTMRARGLKVERADIVVRDRDVRHTFRHSKGKQLDLDFYKSLPERLRQPIVVLLDVQKPSKPTLILVFNGGSNRRKIVMRINYADKKAGIGNIIRSGSAQDRNAINALIGQGVELIEGKL